MKQKNPTAIKIGNRIKQARKMAEMNTQARLLEKIPAWSASRLGNYESGISMPSPDDVMIIANAVQASPAWLMFGIGPIRSSHRDAQAIRHQNLQFIYERLSQERGQLSTFLKAIGISKKKLEEHLDNPFFVIQDRLARKAEQFLKKPKDWFDEQHIESDPLCVSFPDDLRELMSIYSELEKHDRQRMLEIARVFNQNPSAI